MKKVIKCLWVDDEFIDRNLWLHDKITEIEKELSGNGGYDVKFDKFVFAARAIAELEKGSQYDLAIFDYSYSEGDYDFSAIGSKIAKLKMPVVVVTNFIGNYESSRPLPNVVKVFEKSRIDELKIWLAEFFKFESFNLLLLSDIHIDKHIHDGKRSSQMYESLAARIEELQRCARFSGVALTGDFANNAPEFDLDIAKNTINPIVSKVLTESGFDRLLVVPGNHDLHYSEYGKALAASPWLPFMKFYQDLFSPSDQYTELESWNKTSRSFVSSATSDHLSWYRFFPRERLSIIGLCSTSSTVPIGQGHFSDAQRKFVNRHWGKQPCDREVRILIMHHNIFPSISVNHEDNLSTFSNPGFALNVLLENHCNLILNGHSHFPFVHNYHGFHMPMNEWKQMGPIWSISAGTTGGSSRLGNYFQVINFSSPFVGSTREIQVDLYKYIDSNSSWELIPTQNEAKISLKIH